MLYMRAEETYQPLHRKSLKTVNLYISWSTFQHLWTFGRLLDLILDERSTDHFLRFTTCNESSGLLSMIWPFGAGPKPCLFEAWSTCWFNLENVQNIINSSFFILTYFICLISKSIPKGWGSEKMRCEYFSHFSFICNSIFYRSSTRQRNPRKNDLHVFGRWFVDENKWSSVLSEG